MTMNRGEIELVKQIVEAEQEKARIQLDEARARTAKLQAEVEARLQAEVEALLAILHPQPPKETTP
jgi:vacuolar-type H+-ATPase subunit H